MIYLPKNLRNVLKPSGPGLVFSFLKNCLLVRLKQFFSLSYPIRIADINPWHMILLYSRCKYEVIENEQNLYQGSIG